MDRDGAWTEEVNGCNRSVRWCRIRPDTCACACMSYLVGVLCVVQSTQYTTRGIEGLDNRRSRGVVEVNIPPMFLTVLWVWRGDIVSMLKRYLGSLAAWKHRRM